MPSLFDDPMVQAGLAPFLVAFALCALLRKTPWAWLAVLGALATTVALSTGISFSPLTASRKVFLWVLAAPFAAALAERWASSFSSRGAKVWPWALALGGAAVVWWAYASLTAQAETTSALWPFVAVSLFVAALLRLNLNLSEDGPAAAAATLAQGAAVGASALLSASIGNMMNGVALATAGGALLLWQFVSTNALRTGWLGSVTVGTAAAGFASTTFLLAQLPWAVLPLLCLIPLAALAVGRAKAQSAMRPRLVWCTLVTLAVAAAPVAVAWWAPRAG